MGGDKYNFREVILSFPDQLRIDLTFLNQLQLQRRSFKKILICGMGGSGLMDDFFQHLKDFAPLKLPIPFEAHNSYLLPTDADHETLIIVISYSGNTEETISSFEEAQKQNLEIAGLTSGGKLGELFEKNKKPWIKIPANIQPRLSLGFQLNGLIKILMAYGLLAPFAQHEINALAEKLNPAELENQAKELCQKITHKIPVIYASQNNEIMAKLWKIEFNENSKIPAFYNIFPELNHNEMVGWTKNLGPFVLLILNDSDDLPEIKNRMRITAQLLKERQLPVEFIDITGYRAPEKLFNALILGNWLSYHLALFYGQDPTPVEMVEEFKKLIKK